MRTRLLLFFNILFFTSIHAQQSLNSAGVSISTNNVIQSISIGQPFFHYIGNVNLSVTEGVQQSFDSAACVFNFQFSSDSLKICSDSFLLDAGSGYRKYQWSTGDSLNSILIKNSGWYSVQLWNEMGCVGFDSIYVNITGVNIPIGDTAICIGDSIVLSASSIGGVIPSDATTLAQIPSNLVSGVVAYYPLNGDGKDQSGNGNNGVLNNTTPIADRFGKSAAALSFNGVNSFVEIRDSSKLDFNSDFTISSWFNAADLNACAGCTRMILSKNVNGNVVDGGYVYGIWGTTNSFVNFQSTPHFDVSTYANNKLAEITPGKWYHYVASYRKADSSLVYYVNGVPVDTIKIQFDQKNTAHNLIIGAEHTAGGGVKNNFKGSIDDIILFNRSLSESEVLQLYRPASYSVGSRGPAGGYIFYDKGNNIGGWRYLEVAAKDQAPQAQWGCYNQNVPTTTAFLGGYNNNLIFEQNCPNGQAAKICRDATINGYSDWYLPSRDELSMVYDSIFAPYGIGGFGLENGYYNPYWRYWTSSQSGGPNAWAVDFNYFYKQVQSKLEAWCRVRAIRRVSELDQPFAMLPYTYQWSTGETTPSIVVRPNSSQSITVTANNGVNTCSKPINIVVEDLKSFNPLPDSVVSNSDSVVLNVPGSYKSILWNTGSTRGSIIVRAAGWYKVNVVSRGGCIAMDSVFVNLLNSKVVATDTVICKGSSVTLTVNRKGVAVNSNYVIGDKGPAGGIVFYDKGFTSNGWRYLEVSNIDNGANQGMGCYCSAIPNTSDSIGSGLVNTMNWAKLGCSGWATGALNYQINGYGDWFVPSTGELKLIYQNLAAKGLGSFNKAGYWSSTPKPYGSCGIDGGAAVISFADGTEYSDYRSGYGGAGYVRFIRAFAPQSSPAVSWSTGDTTNSIVVKPAFTTTYYVTTSNGIGSVKDSITISVEDMSLYNPLPDTLKACSSTVRLDGGAQNASYLWSTGDTTRYLDVNTKGTYSVSVVSKNGCSGKDSSYVNLLSHVKSSNDTTVCLSSNMVLGVTASSPGRFVSYNWSTGSLNSSIAVTPTANSQYRVRMTDGISVCSDTFNIYVFGKNFNPLPDTTSYCGDSVVLSADPGYSQYTWSHGATASNTTVKSNGYYSVLVKNGSGCQFSDTTYVMLKGVVAVNSNLPDTIKVCGTSVSLNATPGYARYLWNTGSITPTTTVSASGSYSVTISNNLGCSATQSTFVSMVSSKIVASDSLSCNSSGILLSAYQASLPGLNTNSTTEVISPGLKNGLVAWYPFNGNANDNSGNGNNGIVKGANLTSDRFGNASSAYFFRGFGNNDHIKIPNSTSLRIDSVMTISLWYKTIFGKSMNGNGGPSTAGANVIFSKEGDGIGTPAGYYADINYTNNGYYVGYTQIDGCCAARDKQANLPQYSAWVGDTITKWNHLVIENSKSQFKIYLNGVLDRTKTLASTFNAANNLNLYLGIMGSGGTNAPFWYPFYGSIDDVRIYNRSLSSSEINQLTSNVRYKYSWSTGDTTESILVNPTKTTTYYLTVSNGITSCTDSFVVTVRSKPKAEFYVYNNSNCLSSDSIRFVNTSKPSTTGEALSYLWKFGDGTSSTLQSPAHVYAVAGSYTVKLYVSNAYGCIDSAAQLLKFDDLKPQFTVNDATQCLNGNSFIFTNNSTSTYGISNLAWDFGDGSLASGTTVIHSYSATGTYNVNLVVSGATGCVKSLNFPVIISENPKAAFSLLSGQTQCSNDNLFAFSNQSTAPQGSLSYLWNFGDGTIDTAFNATHAYTKAGIYRVQLQATNDLGGCSSLAMTTVRVNPSGDAAFFVGDSAACLAGNQFRFNNASNISSGRIVSYSWEFGNGEISSEINPTVTYKNAGTYQVQMIISTDLGCRDTAHLNLEVWPQPNLNYTINDTVQCIDRNYFIFNNNSSIPAGQLSFVWNFGDGKTDTAKNVEHTYKFIGDYSVTLAAKTEKGCESTLTKNISVKPKAIAAFTVNKDFQCFKNNSFQFVDKSSVATGSYTIEWDFGDGANSVEAAPVHSYSAAGKYTVVLRVNTAFGCADSTTYQVEVYEMPKALFAYGVDSSCLKNNQFDFYNNSSIGSGTFTSFWTFGDSTVSRDAEPSHVYAKDGVYTVNLLVTSDKGCVDSMSRTIQVFAEPKANFKMGIDSMCLKNNQFNFENLSSIANGQLSYVWKFGDNTEATGLNVTHSYTKSGAYSVTLFAVSEHGCTDSLTKKLVVVADPKASFVFNKELSCVKNADYVFKSTSLANFGTLKYNWDLGDGTKSSTDSVQKKYNVKGNYQIVLTVNNSFGCSDTVSKMITVVPNPTASILLNTATAQCLKDNLFQFVSGSTFEKSSNRFNWNFGDGTSSTDTIVSKSYSDTGVYKVSLLITTSYGCNDSSTVNIRVNPHPSVPKLTPDSLLEICEKDAKLIRSNSVWKNQWFFNNTLINGATADSLKVTSAGSYRLRVQDSNGCSTDSKDLSVVINPLPASVFEIPTAKFICENDEVILKSGAAARYDWYRNDTIVQSSNDSIYRAKRAGVYKLKVYSDKGCFVAIKDSVVLGYLGSLKPDFKYDSTCINIPIHFTNLTKWDTAYGVYQEWRFGDGGTSTLLHPTHTYKDSAQYQVKLAMKYLVCDKVLDTTQKTIQLHKPQPSIQYPRLNAKKDEKLQLNARSIGYKYNWVPADNLSSATIQNPFFTAKDETKFLISIRDTFGCTAVDTLQVLVFEKKEIFVPHGFTPNNDGINDLLFPETVGIVTFNYFRVYNRWGKLVYETTRTGNGIGWDGKFNGTPQPMDTYIWVSEGIDEDGKLVKRNGNVVLIR